MLHKKDIDHIIQSQLKLYHSFYINNIVDKEDICLDIINMYKVLDVCGAISKEALESFNIIIKLHFNKTLDELKDIGRIISRNQSRILAGSKRLETISSEDEKIYWNFQDYLNGQYTKRIK